MHLFTMRVGMLLLALTSMNANAEKRTFRTDENWVSRYLKDGGDIKNITGLKLPDKFDVSANFEDVQVREDLPTKFDWRALTPFGLQPIRNQKNCGSCWAFAITAVVEALMVIQRPDQMWPDLSEQELVSTCCNSGDCGGGYFTAFNYVQSKGQGEEKDLPYTARNSSCKKIPPRTKLKRWSYISQPTTEKIKAAIYQYGPVACDVSASGAFMNYSDGVYNSCNSAGTNHMVTVEGWNEEGKYWIMRNSWGKSWGMDGYMHIKYTSSSGRKCNSLCSTAAFAELE